MVLGVEFRAVMGDVSYTFTITFPFLQLQQHCSGAFGVGGYEMCGVNDELLPYDQFSI